MLSGQKNFGGDDDTFPTVLNEKASELPLKNFDTFSSGVSRMTTSS